MHIFKVCLHFFCQIVSQGQFGSKGKDGILKTWYRKRNLLLTC